MSSVVRADSHPRARPWRVLAVTALAVIACTGAVGCSALWDSIRERQRQSSIALSREFVERGSCGRAIESLERAQTRRQLGDFAAESIWMKARCLAAVGRVEEALAHWRMLHDQYPDSRWVERIPKEAEPHLGEPESLRARAAPKAFEIPTPRYSVGARRASVAGSVWVEYRLDEEGRPHELRVIGSAHPLLAAYAIEAVASGRWRTSAGVNTVLPRRAGSTFRFESLWMDEAEDEPLTGGHEPPADAVDPWAPEDDDGRDRPEDEEEEGDEGPWIEWFPQG